MNATKTILVKAFNKAGMWFLIICAAWSYASMTQVNETFDKPAPVGSYEDVLTKHTCEDTVGDEFPTAAILREVGAGYVFTTDPVLIGKGLDEEFADKEWKRFDVKHFCR